MGQDERPAVFEHINTPALRSLLAQQTRLLDQVISDLVANREAVRAIEPDVVEVVILMAQAIGVSIHSILRLTEERDMAIRDCFGIARSVHELALNAAFVVAKGVDEARRAKRHAEQRSYRDKHRTGKVGGYSFEIQASGLKQAAEIPGMTEALAEFAPRKNWPTESPSARVDAINMVSDAAGISFAGANIAVYQLASELLHGSYFGVVHFWSCSANLPAHTRERFAELWTEHFTTVFSATFFSTLAFLQIASEKFSIPDILNQCHLHLRAADEQIQQLVTGDDGRASMSHGPQSS